MITRIEVEPGGWADALCGAVRQWAHVAEAGRLRISPNPLDQKVYLVLDGSQIVARLERMDTMSSPLEPQC